MRRLLGHCLLVSLMGSALVVPAAPVLAQGGMVDTYCAQISENDKFNSDGEALTGAAAMIQQDRANFHRFDLRDPDDQPDTTFEDAEARARIPDLIDNGFIPADVAEAIETDEPVVCAIVYDDAMDIGFGDTGQGEPYEAASDSELPFLGAWNCEVAVFTFTNETYNNGSDDLPIREIQEGSDGSYTLFFDDDYAITVADFTGDTMTWLSQASGDSFTCTRR
jgi:hypothetical protein